MTVDELLENIILHIIKFQLNLNVYYIYIYKSLYYILFDFTVIRNSIMSFNNA